MLTKLKRIRKLTKLGFPPAVAAALVQEADTQSDMLSGALAALSVTTPADLASEELFLSFAKLMPDEQLGLWDAAAIG